MEQKNTLHEHWFRIRDLTLALTSTARVSRQTYTKEVWYIVSSSTSNKYYRLNANTYRVVALLDGEKTVDTVWHAVLKEDPYHAPSQGEVIQILSQLFSVGLITGSIPPDSGAVLRGVQKAEWQNRKALLGGIFFPRIPLYNPEKLLEKIIPLVKPLFSWFGALLWIGLILTAGWELTGSAEELGKGSMTILAPANLPWLYLAIVISKLLHEAGHALSCKIFGKKEGVHTEVNTFGVMLLVFTPLPYVDVSSTWMLVSRFHRILVGLGGVLTELAVAGVAALLWVRVEPGSVLHTMAYNIIFVSGVSTLLFNGNPLLRYDGYYVLCDLLGTPNLAMRANNTLKNMFKRVFFGVKSESQVYNRFESVFFPVYSVLALIYRIIVFAGISMFVADQLFIIGVLVAVTGFFGLAIRPFFKYLHYLFYNHELRGKRKRAIFFSLFIFSGIIFCAGVLPVPDYDRIDGIVEPTEEVSVRAEIDGEVISVSEQIYINENSEIAKLGNPELLAKYSRILAQYEVSECEIKQALVESQLALQIAEEQQNALNKSKVQAERDIGRLVIDTENTGRWIANEDKLVRGVYLKRGDELGRIISCGRMRVRCVATQATSAAVMNEGADRVEIRLKHNPGVCIQGQVASVAQIGSKDLPSFALSDVAGGELITVVDETNQRRSKERLFEILVTFEDKDLLDCVFFGQSVVVRVRISDKPLFGQLWDGLLQILQRKYRI